MAYFVVDLTGNTLKGDTMAISDASPVVHLDTPNSRKPMYDKPIYLSKKQLRTILHGRIIRVHRGTKHFLEIGLKGYKDPAVTSKIEQLKREIKKLKESQR